MSSQVLFSGDAALEDVVSFVQDTPPEALIVCAQSAEELSRITVHLVRRLRGSQGRIEFHQPASPEAMLQAVNRLMQDVPIDELTSTRPGDGYRMLIVERAESAGESEILALRRLASALRGSAFQLVVLAQTNAAPLDHPTLCHLAPQAAVWLVDFSVGFDRFESASSVVLRREAMQAGVHRGETPVAAPALAKQSTPVALSPPAVAAPEPAKRSAPRRPPANNRELADILMQLAQERDKSQKQ
ncbi:MAG: hypothetical protein EBR00_07085 [Gammaproteobacteria bacterium]|nr:hypothetical protein [Gammaproteobacteria bacterium]